MLMYCIRSVIKGLVYMFSLRELVSVSVMKKEESPVEEWEDDMQPEPDEWERGVWRVPASVGSVFPVGVSFVLISWENFESFVCGSMSFFGEINASLVSLV
jgi:hypothetical protein